jgi:MinD-like ATPase involved in chromosome partitioning or flagellar assembly
VPLLPPGLSPADLAARLRDAGYEAEVRESWTAHDLTDVVVVDTPSGTEDGVVFLVVAAKEPSNG